MELSLEKGGMNREQRAVVRAQHFDKESQYLRLRRVRTSLKEFTILAMLGKGGYGQVYLCRKVDTGEVLALKQMKKSRFTDRNEVHRVKKEREVMTKTDSIWLARLKYCFQSQHYLYMAMEYIPGGDLKTLLDHMTVLDETDAKFLFAEMALAVDALHQLGYIHRDLKPDNFMIDRNGHLKLIDFGLSKEGFSEKLNTSRSLKRRTSSFRVGTWSKNNTSILPQFTKSRNKKRQIFSVVGSPEYMALEILNQEGYSNLVDYWSLGVILFEFLFGYTPFGAETVAGVFDNVKNFRSRVVKPPRDEDDEDEEISDDCWDLIIRLITSADQRLGKNGINDLKNHRWFKGFDWGGIRDMEPPFMPNLESENDTSYFPSDNPVVQSGLAELEAENDDLDHLISKQLARSSESNSMESVFDHRSGKPKSKTSQAFSITNAVPGDSAVTHTAASVININAGGGASSSVTTTKAEKGSGSGRNSRRGSSRRNEAPNSSSPSVPAAVAAANAINAAAAASGTPDSILSVHVASPSPPPPLEPGEHPKLKFNQSYSKFDFAGFTFKHEDFSVLDNGSPRGEENSRERSNSTVDLEHLPPLEEGAPAFVQALSPRGGSGAGIGFGGSGTVSNGSGTSSLQITPGSSPATMDSLLFGGNSTRSHNSNNTLNSVRDNHRLEEAAFSAPTTTSAFSAANNAQGTPSGSGISLINKRNLMGSANSSNGGDKGVPSRNSSTASNLGSSSPSSTPGSKGSSKHRTTASLTGAPRSGSTGMSHRSGNDDEEPADSVSRLGQLGRTATVQVIDTSKHRSSSASSGTGPNATTTHSDAIRHADSTPLSRKGGKVDDIDSLKRRLTKLKKNEGGGEDSSAKGSPVVGHVHAHSTGSGGGDSRSNLYSSDSGNLEDSMDGSSTIKKKKSTMRKLLGLIGAGKSSDKVAGDSSGKEGTPGTPGTPHIVVSTKGSSSSSSANQSPSLQQSGGGKSPRDREKPIVMTSANSPAKTSSTPPPTSSTGAGTSAAATGSFSSPETPSKENSRTRAGTMGDEAPPIILPDSPEFVSIRSSGHQSRHRSEGRGHHRSKTSSRDAADPTNASSPQGEPRTPSRTKKRSSSRAGSVTSMEGPPTPESTSKRSYSKRSSSKRDSSRKKSRPTEETDGSIKLENLTAEVVSGMNDSQLRKERLLALARAFQESQANTVSAAVGSLQLSTVDRTGSQSAASSSKSSPRTATSSSPLRGGGRGTDRDSNKGDKSDRSDRSDRTIPSNYPPLHERLTPTLSQITDDYYSSEDEGGHHRTSSSNASTAPPSTGSNASRSKRGSDKRSKRDSPSTPRRRLIDPVEEASNEATPQSTPFATPDRPIPSNYSTPGSEDQDSPLSAGNKTRSKTSPLLPSVSAIVSSTRDGSESPVVSPKKKTKERGETEILMVLGREVEVPKTRSPASDDSGKDSSKTPRKMKDKVTMEAKAEEGGKNTEEMPRRKSTPRHAGDMSVDSPARRKASKDGDDKLTSKDSKKIGRRKSDLPSVTDVPSSSSAAPPTPGSSTRKVALTLRTGDIARFSSGEDDSSPTPTSARKREKAAKEHKEHKSTKEMTISPRDAGRERSNSTASKSPRP